MTLHIWTRIAVAFLATMSVNAQQPSFVPGVSSSPTLPNASSNAGNPTQTVPQQVYFNGTLTQSVWKPGSGSVGIAFSFYADSEGGSPLWSETQNTQPDDQGHYTVILGATRNEGLPLDLFAAGKAHWLGVQVLMPGAVEQPRFLLLAVPYALKAADADTLGGLPASSFVRAGNTQPMLVSDAVAPVAVEPLHTFSVDSPLAGCAALTSDGTATANHISKFTSPCTLEPSAIFEAGGKVGIGITTPAATLDVKGSSLMRGTLELPATGVATAATGFNSQPMDFLGSAFNSVTNAAVSQHFRWQAEPAPGTNDTPNPSGVLNLLYATGGMTPVETGFSISSGGLISFPAGQTFPSLNVTGNATVAGNVSATQLVSTAAAGTPPLTVNSTTQVPNLNASLLGGLPASSFDQVGQQLDYIQATQPALPSTYNPTFQTLYSTPVGRSA